MSIQFVLFGGCLILLGAYLNITRRAEAHDLMHQVEIGASLHLAKDAIRRGQEAREGLLITLAGTAITVISAACAIKLKRVQEAEPPLSPRFDKGKEGR